MAGMVAPMAPGRWPDHVSGEWTVADLDALPDNGLRYEILDGILQVSPAPVPLHQRVVARLLISLTEVCPAGFEVFIAPIGWQPDGRTSLEPDLLVVPKNAIGPTSITGTPALVVEVLSPSTARIDRMLKFSRYAEGGIGQYWMVDPAGPSIQVYDLVDGRYELLVEGTGSEQVSVAGLLQITVLPSALVDG